MPDKKLTDNEIKKALECCGDEEELHFCTECPYCDKENDFCQEDLHRDVLDLINRQKAEIERLCAEVDELIIAKDLLFDEAEALIKKAKVEAYKEFAERVKSRLITVTYINFDDIINNLLKEMVGENNETKTF